MIHAAVPPRRVHRRRRLLPLVSRCLVALALVSLAATPAAAAIPAGTVLVPAAGTAVRAGEWIHTRWVPLPREMDEFELLLLLDGDVENAPRIRLTGQLGPGRLSYLWQVPNLPCRSARLLLRFSLGHDEEEEAVPGEPFSIVGTVFEPTARLSFVGGEWWLASGGGSWPVRLPGRDPRMQADAPMGPPAQPAVATEGWRGQGESASLPVRPLMALSRATMRTSCAAPFLSRPRTTPQRE